MDQITSETMDALERVPGFLQAMEREWAWAVWVIAAVVVVRFAIVPLVRAWRGGPE